MTIVYTLVARESVVLAEFSATHQANAKAIARKIIEKINGNNNDMNASYLQDQSIFHVQRTDGVTVLCMSDDDVVGRRIPYTFLEDIHERFVRTYGRAVLSAQAYGMNDEFSRVLSRQMDHYSADLNADRINHLEGETSQVRTVMIEDTDKVSERGDRLDIFVDKTDTIQSNTLRFKKQSRPFKNTIWSRNVKPMCFSNQLFFIAILIPILEWLLLYLQPYA